MFILLVGRTIAALSVMTNPPQLTGDSGSSHLSHGVLIVSVARYIGWLSVSQPETL